MSRITETEIVETIERLLKSDITAYRIYTQTGVGQAKISRLKSKEIKINNLTLNVAMKLYEYAKGNNI
ncbi:hypothetical protein [Staphylococcus capitis]|uniref:hypothetical protein n=1 Tax=Staphylococcus capitis TaxID=29388 RepID=UPI00145B7890|nr:hypothetical protein [Staphylococcus capitis]MEB5628485.1 hypothetical protein [Staphylococcus capitis]NMK91267.1 hypothetical protein [Staphylococcus capitis]